jgi:2-keto-3-deoxy-L-rhamnonate aldolase RhmA
MKRNSGHEFKERLRAGQRVFGPLVGPGNDPEATVDAIKAFGYDFFMVDNEHSLVNKETVYVYVRFAREEGLPILIRPEEHYANFRCFLDGGVNGLMLPRVDTVEQAVRAVNRAYFPPLGHRGSGIGMSPFLLDGLDPASTPLLTMMEYVNANTLLFPQTESLTAVANLAQILKLDGVTGTIVGTNDLALDIGDVPAGALRSEVNSAPRIEDRLRQVAHVCRESGKVAGIGGFPPRGCARWAEEGYQLFTLGYVIDGNVSKFEAVVKEARELVG